MGSIAGSGESGSHGGEAAAGSMEEQKPITSGAITIYPERFEVFVDRERVHLSLTQFRMLALMARRPGWVFSPRQIRESLRLDGPHVDASSIKNHIYVMRRKLGRAGARHVETVRGVGYRVTPEPGDSANTSPDES